MGDWKKTGYGAPDTWEQQQRKERDRQFDAKHPTTWRDRLYIGWMGFLLVALGIASLISIGFVLVKLFA